MRIASKLWTVVALGLVGSLLVTSPSSAAPGEGAVVEFTVDNAADIGDARPGDGRCEIATENGKDDSNGKGSKDNKAIIPKTPPTIPLLGGGKGVPAKTIPTLYPPITPPTVPDGDGLCTLRAAVEESNAVSGATHVVTLPSDLGVYHLTEGQLRVRGSLKLFRDFSEGSKRSAINAGHRSRIFFVEPGASLEVDGMFLAQGKPAGSAGGGAILVSDGAYADVDRSVIVNNHASFGGGIYVASGGRLDTHYTSYESNAAQSGGAIYSLGDVHMDQSSVYNNTADGFGGGLFLNTHHDGHLWALNSSILHNTSGKDGGGMYRYGNGFTELRFVTVAGNSARQGGGLFNTGSAIRVAYSVVADNLDTTDPSAATASPDCVGELESSGTVNLIGVANTSCSGYDVSRDVVGSAVNPIDPGLEPIRVSSDGNRWGDGGELAYRRPGSGSPLLDVLPADRCTETRDMLGPNSRHGVSCDLGAIER